jgi:hypothetical protein
MDKRALRSSSWIFTLTEYNIDLSSTFNNDPAIRFIGLNQETLKVFIDFVRTVRPTHVYKLFPYKVSQLQPIKCSDRDLSVVSPTVEVGMFYPVGQGRRSDLIELNESE